MSLIPPSFVLSFALFISLLLSLGHVVCISLSNNITNIPTVPPHPQSNRSIVTLAAIIFFAIVLVSALIWINNHWGKAVELISPLCRYFGFSFPPCRPVCPNGATDMPLIPVHAPLRQADPPPKSEQNNRIITTQLSGSSIPPTVYHPTDPQPEAATQISPHRSTPI
ncbi:hypothetical protein BU17DRAFT_96030 [Hysterangium stoloniferum]|nr:hypothetical protein BU17DRAFT_96030 [Hysterangium stoloniferum]